VWFVVTNTFLMTVAITADPMKAPARAARDAETIVRDGSHYCLDRVRRRPVRLLMKRVARRG